MYMFIYIHRYIKNFFKLYPYISSYEILHFSIFYISTVFNLSNSYIIYSFMCGFSFISLCSYVYTGIHIYYFLKVCIKITNAILLSNRILSQRIK